MEPRIDMTRRKVFMQESLLHALTISIWTTDLSQHRNVTSNISFSQHPTVSHSMRPPLDASQHQISTHLTFLNINISQHETSVSLDV